MAQTSVGHIHVCAISMEETKRYRQQSAKTVQGSDGYAFGMLSTRQTRKEIAKNAKLDEWVATRSNEMWIVAEEQY